MNAVTFRRVTRADFPLLAEWLAHPHVARWWNHETSPEAVERDFGAAVDGTEPSEDFLLLVDGVRAGLIQRSRLADYPEELEAFAELTEVPDGTVIVDYFIGAEQQTGHGLGTAMIAALIERTWTDLPGTPAVLVAVVAANRNSWRALERAGLRRVAEGAMEPDNPVDDPLHFVYRVDRP
ncbi:GNAT family N-acetyltransferase [Kribbella italica]|uniref:Aminoglycoside 6'-N-acetyltransferase n=1 Tax=Kribbella italica TaxID=1540520 RepID=A0A7W9MWD1_9ACTN|nr:GNAT family N-acetyltransferase [Kribbella italica]MBB5838140.1 aminoglycoside 6'-N-acetyltransferase [Kribbella italica]